MEEKLELRLINPNENGFLEHIDWNMDEIRSKVQVMMSAYTNVVYTEDAMKSAREDRAALNRFKKLIEDRRKEIKKKCMEPYNRFDKEVKEVLALIDEPIGAIDTQIKNYEKAQKEEKKKKIQTAYDESIGELADILPFERIFDTKYLNADCTVKKATAGIKESIETVKRDLQTIDALDGKYRINVKDIYVRTLDLSQALAEERRLKDLEERLEADRRAKEEAERKRLAAEEARRAAEADAEAAKARMEQEREEDAVTQAQEPAPVQAESKPEAPEFMPKPDMEAPKPRAEEKRYRAAFYCIGTLEQIKGLRSYMVENNIQFGRVEE